VSAGSAIPGETSAATRLDPKRLPGAPALPQRDRLRRRRRTLYQAAPKIASKMMIQIQVDI